MAMNQSSAIFNKGNRQYFSRLSLVCLASVILFFGLSTPATGEVFFDDFNRSDGPLEDPWFLMNSYLYIESQRVVANTSEFGNMGYMAATLYLDASIEFDLCFNGDNDDGRFHLYIGGGEDEQSAWGFSGVVGTYFVELRRFFPEEDLASAYYPSDAGAVFHARLEYLIDIGRVSLTLEDHQGIPVVYVDAVASVDGPFAWCAIGIENVKDSEKWLDNVLFIANGSPAAVPGADIIVDSLICNPNPFNPRMSITFELNRPQHAEVAVYDVAGRLLGVLADRTYDVGEHSVVWNGKDAAGRAVPSGTYVVRLETESSVEARKVMLLR